MNNLTFCKTLSLSCIVLIGLLGSCAKDNSVDMTLSKEVKTAKDWFDLNKNQINKKAIDSYQGLDPLWDKARVLGMNIEIPYTIMGGKMIIPSNEIGELAKGRTRLVMVKNADDYAMHIVDFIPNSRFVGNIREVSAFNFKEKKFSGRMCIHLVQSNKVQIFEVTDGQLTKVFYGELENKKQEDLEKRDEYCIEFYLAMWTWEEGSTEWTFDDQIDELIHLYSWCTPDYAEAPCVNSGVGPSGAGDPTLCPDPCLPWCN